MGSDTIEMVETSPNTWEADFISAARDQMAARLKLGGIVAFYAFVFAVLWVHDFK